MTFKLTDWLNHDDVRSATSFRLFVCPDPNCGVHVLSLDEDEGLICQTVLSQQEMKAVIEQFYKILRTHNQ